MLSASRFVGFAMLFVGLALMHSGHANSEKLEYAERSKLNRLLEDYRRSAEDPQKRRELAAEMLAIGEGTQAAEDLLKRIDQDLRLPLRNYGSQLHAAAKAVVSKKERDAGSTSLRPLQRDIRDLQKMQNKLTRADIEKVADPAMRQLRSVYAVEAKELVSASDGLKVQRQEILNLGTDWGACRAKLKMSGTDFEEWLKLFEYLTVSRAGLASRAARQMEKNEEELLKMEDPREAMGIRDVNFMRVLAGFNPMALDLRLCDVARDHSKDMKKLNFFSHTSPVKGKTSMVDRGRLGGIQVNGENIFRGNTDPFMANKAWFFSPGHHLLMFNANFSRVGLGRDAEYWTLVFGR